MPIPQAPRWEDPERVQNTIDAYREISGISPDDKDDYQLSLYMENVQPELKGISKSNYVQDDLFNKSLNRRYPFMRTSPTGGIEEENYQEEETRQIQSKAVGRNIVDKFFEVDKFADKGAVKDLYFTGAGLAEVVAGGFGLLDSAFGTGLEDGWRRAYRSGANQSITGLAGAIITGDTPYELDERDYDGTIAAYVEDATAFGLAMVYDWYFLLATRGLGIGVHLAGGMAKKKAAENLARIYLGQELKTNASKIGLKSLVKEQGEKNVSKYIGNTIKQGRKKGVVRNSTVDDVKKSMIRKLTDDGFKPDVAMIDDLAESALQRANVDVLSHLSKPGLTGTIKSIGGKKLNKDSFIEISKLRQATRHLGQRGVFGFGVYSATGDILNQWSTSIQNRINPETGERFTRDEANNIATRFMTDYIKGNDQTNVREQYGLPQTNADGSPVDWNLLTNDWKRTLASFLHGSLGAYVASATGGVFKMGREGAFKNSPSKTFNKLQEKAGEYVYSKALEYPTEALGFTGSTMILSKMLQGLGIEDEPLEQDKQTFGEQFLHNLVTVGVLKKMGYLKEKGKDVIGAQKDAIVKKVVESTEKKKEKYNEVEKKLDPENEFDRNFINETRERSKKIDKKSQADIAEINEKVKQLNKELESESGLDLKAAEKGQIKFKKNYKIVTDENGKKVKVPRMTVDQAEKISTLVQEIQTLKNRLIEEYGIVPQNLMVGGKKMGLVEIFEADIAGEGQTGKMFNDLRNQIEGSRKRIGEKSVEEITKEGEQKRISLEQEASAKKQRLDSMNELNIMGIKSVLDSKGNKVSLKKATQEELNSALQSLEKKQIFELQKEGRIEVEQGNTIEKASKKLENEPLSTTIKKTIQNNKTGDKSIDSENQTILEYIGKRKSRTEKSKSGGDVKEAQKFASWLFKNHGISIKNATKTHLQEYLDTGNNGKPFGFGAKEPSGRTKGNNQKKINIMRWVRELSGLKGQGLSEVEALSSSKMERLTAREMQEMSKKGKAKRTALDPSETTSRIETFNKEVSTGDITLKSGKKAKSSVGHFVSFIIGLYGKRSQALKDLSFKAGDVGKVDGNLIITVTDKGGQPFVLRVPKGKIMGVDYYKEFSKILKLDAKAEVLVDSNGKRLTSQDIVELGNRLTGKSSTHIARDNIYEIAARLDQQGVNPSGGKHSPDFWTNFAKDSLVGHGKNKSGVGNEVLYGAGKASSTELANIKLFWDAAGKIKPSKKQLVTREFADERKPGEPMIDRIIDTKTGEIISEQVKLFGKNKPSDWMREQIQKDRSKNSREVNLLRDMQAEELVKLQNSTMGSTQYEISRKRIDQYKALEKQALTKQQVMVENPLKQRAIERVIDIMVARNPGLQVVFQKNKQYAGEFVDGIIKITEGKADATTFFHENTHRLEAVVKATNNKQLLNIWKKGEAEVISWAKKNNPELYRLYEKTYSKDRLANELMTQLSAESALKGFARESTWLGRGQNWIKQLVSRLKVHFGLGSPKDIARMYGKIAREGFSTDGIKLKLSQPKYQELKDSAPTVRQRNDFELVRKEQGLDGGMIRFLMQRIPQLRDRADLNVTQKGTIEGPINGAEMQLLTDMMAIVNTKSFKVNRNKQHSKLLKQAVLARVSQGITTEQSQKIAEVLGIPKNSLKFASEQQLKSFIDFVDKVGVKYDPYEGILKDNIMEQVNSKSAAYEYLKQQGLMKGFSTDIVLRKLGLEKLADNLLDHYQLEGQATGIGLDAIYRANALFVKDAGGITTAKGFANRFFGSKEIKEYAPFALDPTLLEPTTINGKQVQIKPNAGRDKFIEQSKIEGTPEYKATNILRDMYDAYYNAFVDAALTNIKNPAMADQFKTDYTNKYVKSYFTRVLTKEARNEIADNASSFKTQAKKLELDLYNQMRRKIIREIDKLENQKLEFQVNSPKYRFFDKEIKKKISEQNKLEKDYLNKDSDFAKEIQSAAIVQLNKMVNRTNNGVGSHFLTERAPRLDNLIVGKDGKVIQTYETNFEKVFNKYQRNMSRTIANAKFMPEFQVELRPYIESAGVKTSIERLNALSKGDEVHKFVELTINRAVGNVPVPTQLDGWIQNVTAGSAVIGLSSPFSGLKNFMIGSQMTIGVMGLKNFASAMAEVKNIDAWSEARKMGRLQFGTKEVELGKLSNFVGRTISLMNTTESINRIVGSQAGLLTAQQLIKKSNGETSLLNRTSQAEAKLAKLFRLKPDEIGFLKKYGFHSGEGTISTNKKVVESTNTERLRIIEKIKHYGHITTQGSSGNPFLPVWASSNTGKALTLFYRMAYSGTSNIYNHIVKPAKQGNILPLMRYTFAGSLNGALLWGLYDSVLGTKNPKVNEDELAILGANLAKSETLGIFSFLLNPYRSSYNLGDYLSTDLIMEPVALRNAINLGMFVKDATFSLSEDKEVNLYKSFGDLITNSITVAGHINKLRKKSKTPFAQDVKAIRSFRYRFHEKQGGDSLTNYKKSNPFTEKTEKAEMYSLIRDAFQGTEEDLKMAAQFYMATWFTLYDKQRFLDTRLGRNHKKAKAIVDNQLQQVIKRINPLHFSNYRKAGLLYREDKEFYNYLNEENRELAKRVQKQYSYRKRKFDKYLIEAWKKHGGYYKRGEIVDLLPFPPSQIDAEFKLKPSGATRLRQQRSSN